MCLLICFQFLVSAFSACLLVIWIDFILNFSIYVMVFFLLTLYILVVFLAIQVYLLKCHSLFVRLIFCQFMCSMKKYHWVILSFFSYKYHLYILNSSKTILYWFLLTIKQNLRIILYDIYQILIVSVFLLHSWFLKFILPFYFCLNNYLSHSFRLSLLSLGFFPLRMSLFHFPL